MNFSSAESIFGETSAEFISTGSHSITMKRFSSYLLLILGLFAAPVWSAPVIVVEVTEEASDGGDSEEASDLQSMFDEEQKYNVRRLSQNSMPGVNRKMTGFGKRRGPPHTRKLAEEASAIKPTGLVWLMSFPNR